ncbi:tRNA modification GTPase MnmE-like [Tropilaelaps mercedesae]|uniref:tRNA modification GTPase MnmE-like n=1 Tax=Tropilaelaps mercedesae TaxID=418985 RepID=A0A1V9XMM2_9ACAR|nr:tRNA modification GTPase MnmE-like [Tropilaelaps mercedesae]
MVMSSIGGVKSKPEHARVYVRKLRHPKSGKEIDKAVLLWFRAPNSFTALASVDGLRSAEPGEFAKRAFVNQKMDLTQAESLADLIDAETDAQLEQAIRDLGGLPIILCDTAGARWKSDDPVEIEGIRRAKDFSRQAHLNILLTDNPALVENDRHLLLNYGDAGPTKPDSEKTDSIVVLNKVDLFADFLQNRARNSADSSGIDFVLSCYNGYGIEELTRGIVTRLRDRFVPAVPPLVIRERQKDLIEEALSNIERCLRNKPKDAAISAEYLRRAMLALGRISGKVGAEEVLDLIFSQFCIGK